jgi:glycosyltransferase involved in cell wall biosynthesis
LARVLFVYSRDSSFVSIDREALAQHHEVRNWQQRGARVNPLALLRAIRNADLVFGWFASWHTFLPVTFARLMRRPAVLVAGGYDTARMPEIGYGIQQHRLLGPVSRWVLRRATRIVTNSRYTAVETAAIKGVDPAKVTVVHHGVPDPFGSLPQGGRERLALSVGIVDERNLERKGLGPFARAAALLPDVHLAVVGRWDDEAGERLRSEGPANLEVTGWVDDDELERWYRRASVYVQPSRHEGFGLSLAEAMLAGCVPVHTRAGALPEVVGDTGVPIDEPSPEQIAAGVLKALEAGPERRAAARERVLQEFPLSARREGLESVVRDALAERG